MKISKLESALILTEAIVELGPHAHEKEIYDEVYAFLDYAEEQAAESEELDEETEYELTPIPEGTFDGFGDEYELTPAGIDVTEGLLPYVDIEEDFNDFSPSVGTFEGTRASFLHDILPASELRQRAPVAERVHVPFNAAKTIGEAFQPCGAD